MHQFFLIFLILIQLSTVFAGRPPKQSCTPHIPLIQRITNVSLRLGFRFCSEINGVPPPTATETSIEPERTETQTITQVELVTATKAVASELSE